MAGVLAARLTLARPAAAPLRCYADGRHAHHWLPRVQRCPHGVCLPDDRALDLVHERLAHQGPERRQPRRRRVSVLGEQTFPFSRSRPPPKHPGAAAMSFGSRVKPRASLTRACPRRRTAPHLAPRSPCPPSSSPSPLRALTIPFLHPSRPCAERYTDFAGSGIVHCCGGTAALIGAIIVGPRQGYVKETNKSVARRPPARLPLSPVPTHLPTQPTYPTHLPRSIAPTPAPRRLGAWSRPAAGTLCHSGTVVCVLVRAQTLRAQTLRTQTLRSRGTHRSAHVPRNAWLKGTTCLGTRCRSS